MGQCCLEGSGPIGPLDPPPSCLPVSNLRSPVPLHVQLLYLWLFLSPWPLPHLMASLNANLFQAFPFLWSLPALMNSMQTCNSVTFYFMKNSFSDISRKCFLPHVNRTVPALIILGKMHILLISEKEFFHEIKRDGITSLHGIHVW